MMISDGATPLVIEIAKQFMSLLRDICPIWSKGYLRFSQFDSVSGVKSSYAHDSAIEIIDVLKHKEFFHSMNRRGGELLAAIEKSEGVFLLIVDSGFNYEIKFEYEDRDRWKISKIDGGTGIPEGIE